MPSPSLGNQRILIEAIFHEQDQKLRKAFRERMEKMERREQLTRVSGIRDEALLDRLIELDITAETLAALELVPLVFVAWADGGVQAEERKVIVALAEAAGIESQDGRYPPAGTLAQEASGRRDAGGVEAVRPGAAPTVGQPESRGTPARTTGPCSERRPGYGGISGVRRQDVFGRTRHADRTGAGVCVRLLGPGVC